MPTHCFITAREKKGMKAVTLISKQWPETLIRLTASKQRSKKQGNTLPLGHASVGLARYICSSCFEKYSKAHFLELNELFIKTVYTCRWVTITSSLCIAVRIMHMFVNCRVNLFTVCIVLQFHSASIFHRSWA